MPTLGWPKVGTCRPHQIVDIQEVIVAVPCRCCVHYLSRQAQHMFPWRHFRYMSRVSIISDCDVILTGFEVGIKYMYFFFILYEYILPGANTLDKLSGCQWFENACLASSHCFDRKWVIVFWTIKNKFQWNTNENISFNARKHIWKFRQQNGRSYVLRGFLLAQLLGFRTWMNNNVLWFLMVRNYPSIFWLQWWFC